MSILDKLPGRQPYVRATTDRELIVQRARRAYPSFTAIDSDREARVLDDLAAETAATDPWTAATKLFGEARGR